MIEVSNIRPAFGVEAEDVNNSSIGCALSLSSACEGIAVDLAGEKFLNQQQKIFRAVLRSFSNVDVLKGNRLVELSDLSRRQGQRLLYWLDISGLALYFLDRITQLQLVDVIPIPVLARLQENLCDNTLRTRGMITESIAIQCDFQMADLRYAVMKGISLTPVSVPRLDLRHQFDLDYLIDEKDAPEARRILERRGYRVYAISGRTWEFKIHETPLVSLKDLYKDLPYRSVELHLESGTKPESRLDRLVHREMFGITMPVLSPVDLFLGQAMHAFKDVCSAFSRAAHLLEFYRHVLARQHDDKFWSEVRIRAEGDRKSSFGIGVVTDLMTLIMGDFAPEALKVWTVNRLPVSTRLWIALYGQRVVFSKDPGTKLYLLLQKELEAIGGSAIRPIKKSLWPARLPPPVVRAGDDESLLIKIARYRIQVRFIVSRLRFHIVEGFHYMVESYHWRQYLDRLS